MWWETSGGLHTEWVPAPRMRRFGFEGLWESSGQCLCLWSVSTTLLWEDETCLTGLWNNLYHLIFRTRELCHKVSLWTNLDHFILCFSPFACEPNCRVWRRSRQDCPHFGHCPQVWGLAKTTVRFEDVLEGPMELSEGRSTHSCGVLQGEETDWNQPKGETQGWVRDNFLVSSALWSQDELRPLPPSIDAWHYAWNIANQGCSPEFLLGLHYIDMIDGLISHVVKLIL